MAKKAGQKTIVVLSVPGAVVMPWSTDVAASFLVAQVVRFCFCDYCDGVLGWSIILWFPHIAFFLLSAD